MCPQRCVKPSRIVQAGKYTSGTILDEAMIEKLRSASRAVIGRQFEIKAMRRIFPVW